MSILLGTCVAILEIQAMHGPHVIKYYRCKNDNFVAARQNFRHEENFSVST